MVLAPAASQKENTPQLGPLLESFVSLLQVGILGEVSGKGRSRIFISSPGVHFHVHGLH